MRKSIKKVSNYIFTILLVVNLITTAIAGSFANDYNRTKQASVVLGIAAFSDEEKASLTLNNYSELDSMGRCGTACACISEDTVPLPNSRGNISEIKPSGFQFDKYEGIIKTTPPYLYNRCHLIAYELTGCNDVKNLVTGTRYMNEEMQKYEDAVHEYVKNNSGKHVLYKATPVFENNNLVCEGIRLDIFSVEDEGATFNKGVFCYNVQPGVHIDYADGKNMTTTAYNEIVKKAQKAQAQAKTYANGKSKTSNNSQKNYDSGVYYAQNGECYHIIKGCSGAYLTSPPSSTKNYRPCSKCCKTTSYSSSSSKKSTSKKKSVATYKSGSSTKKKSNASGTKKKKSTKKKSTKKTK